MFAWNSNSIGRWFAALAAALSLILLAAPSRAVNYSWISAGGGSFTNPANWQPLNPGLGQIGPGGASDTVNFDLGLSPAARYLVASVAGANDQLLVHNDSLTLNLSNNYVLVNTNLGSLSSLIVGLANGDSGDVILSGVGILATQHGIIGHAAGSSGGVTVDGLQWTGNGALSIGSAGAGTLTIQNGGSVSYTTGVIGGGSGSSGMATVTGAGSTWTNDMDLTVGQGGAGALIIADGGEVEVTGTFRLSGLASSTGTLNIGDGGAAGILNTASVTSGSGVATLNFNHLDLDYYFTNDGTAGGGSVAITGTTSVNHLGKGTTTLLGAHTYTGVTTVRNGMLVVDAGSIGTAGANVIISELATNNGKLNITNGGSLTSAAGTIGDDQGASGTVTVDGPGSAWNANGQVDVGNSGNATLRIQGGGNVSDTHGVLAFGSSAVSTAVVTGDGSSWSNSADLIVGRSGNAMLTVEDGGSVDSVAGRIGVAMGSIGTATITGADSAWASSGDLTVGELGRGTLNVDDGGSVTNNAGIVGSDAGAGSSGTAVVTGDGSVWTNAGTLSVGVDGTGELTIEAGGRVNDEAAAIGANTGSNGTVTVTGAGSTWANTGNLTVGDSGAGALTIEAGGTVSNRFGFVAASAGSTGTALVTGAGSTWTNELNLRVGGVSGGAGTLSITDGGEVVVGNSLEANATSEILLDGGKLTVNLFSAGGLAALDWQSGTLRLTTVGGLTIGPGGLFGPALLLNANQALEVDEALAVDGGATLFAGGGLKTGSATIAAGAQLFVGGDDQHFGSGLTNNNHLVFSSSTTVTGPVTNAAGGAITALDDVTFNDLVDGPGGFFGPGTITFAGGMAPGASPADVGFEGNVVFDADNTLFIELGGLIAGTEHDKLSLLGAIELAGTLDVSLIDTGAGVFSPAAGDVFEIISAAGGITGAFAPELLPTLPGDLTWKINYGANSVTLAVALAGDFNFDGAVDAADYVVWRKTDGTTEGYDAWRDNFGATTGGGSLSNSTVPEPTTAWLLMLGTALTCCSRRYQGKKSRPEKIS